MGTIVTTVFALLSMLSLVWAGYWMIRAPYIGFDWSVDTRTVVTGLDPVSYTHLRAHETVLDLVCRLLLEKKKHYLHY